MSAENKMRKWLSLLVMSVSTLFIVLVVLEIGGRIYIWGQTRTLPVDFASLQWNEVHQYDPDTLWVLRPNISEPGMPFQIYTNGIGLRNAEIRPLENQLRVLTLGDSRTFGDGSSNIDTWQAALERKFNEARPGYIEVINGGVCGWSAYQGLRYLEKRGLALQPDIVIAAFGTNEWAPPSKYGAGLVEWQDLTRCWGIEALVRQAVRGAFAMLHTPPFGSREFRMSPGEFTDALVRMHHLCKEQDILLYLLCLPIKQEIVQRDWRNPPSYLMDGIAAYLGTVLLDPKEHFPENADDLFVDSMHYSPAGNQFVADYLYHHLPHDWRPPLRK